MSVRRSEHVLARYGFPLECMAFTVRTLPVLIGGDYGVFIFLLGVGTQPVGTLHCEVGSCESYKLTHILTISLARVRSYP